MKQDHEWIVEPKLLKMKNRLGLDDEKVGNRVFTLLIQQLYL